MAKEKTAGGKTYRVVPAAVLLLILAVSLMSIRKKAEKIPVIGTDVSESEFLSDEQTEGEDADGQEESLTEPDSGEDSMQSGILKEKEAFRETDDITMGIDVSKFQETIDWEQVAESGVDFACGRRDCGGRVCPLQSAGSGSERNLDWCIFLFHSG